MVAAGNLRDQYLFFFFFASLSMSAVALSSRNKVHFGSRSAEKSFFLYVLVLQLQLVVLFISSDSGIYLGGLGRCSACFLKIIQYSERSPPLFSAFVQIGYVRCNAAGR